MKSYVIAGIYDCGQIINEFDGSADHALFIALDDGTKSVLLRDQLPTLDGSTCHRLACAVTGYTLRSSDIQLADILGQPVRALVEVHADGTVLRRVESFPRAPRYSMPRSVHVTESVELGGAPGAPRVVGGDIVPLREPLPEPPKPRAEPAYWRIADLAPAQSLEELPAIVARTVKQSREWQAVEAKTAHR